MSKRPPNHPDRFNPATPEWMRNSVLSTRLVNVLVAGGLTDPDLLRQMIRSEEGRRRLWAFANMGRVGMRELRNWAERGASSVMAPDRPGRYLTNQSEVVSMVFVDGKRAVDSDGYSYEAGVWQDAFGGQRGNDIASRAPDDAEWCLAQATALCPPGYWIKKLTEAKDMSPAICRTMAHFWNKMADAIEKDRS